MFFSFCCRLIINTRHSTLIVCTRGSRRTHHVACANLLLLNVCVAYNRVRGNYSSLRFNSPSPFTFTSLHFASNRLGCYVTFVRPYARWLKRLSVCTFVRIDPPSHLSRTPTRWPLGTGYVQFTNSMHSNFFSFQLHVLVMLYMCISVLSCDLSKW